MVHAYIGLGSNLGDSCALLRQAFTALNGLPRTRLLAHSRLYRNPPLGPAAQPDYVNAVAVLETALEPEALLDALQAIEQAAGRVRGDVRWGPRTLDLDLLLYGGHSIHSARLTVPHPGLAERAFVLHPLFEVAPGLVLPDGRHVRDLAAACPADSLHPIAD